ncbi:MAG: hypothetical protein R6X14_04470 [bacterium]
MVSVPRFIFGNLGIKLTALVLAAFLWLFAVLDRSYVTSFAVPIAVAKVETKKIVSELQPRLAEVRIEGRGRDLVFFRLRQPRFLLTVPEALPGTKQLRINPADLDIPANLSIRAIVPEQVEYRLSEVGSRRVAVEVPTRGKLARGLTVSGVEPLDRVTLLGPEDDVRLYATVLTDSLDLGRVRRSDTIRLRVQPPDEDGFHTDPETIAVAVTVEREEARILLGIPVRVVAPEDYDVEVRPSEAQIAVSGPSSRFDELKPTDVRARIRISGLKPGEHRLAAEITLPPGFQLVKCEPALFDIIIR